MTQWIRLMLVLTKPRITSLNIMATAAGLWLAPGSPSWSLAVLTIVGATLVVASANTLNMYWERDIDGRMARTASRPLPLKQLPPSVALWFGLALGLVGVPVLAFGANPLTGFLAAIALFLYVMVYTPLKQKTPHSLLIGAIPGAMPPVLGWTAAAGELNLAALALFGVLFFWQLPHFLAIALFRENDYRKAGFKVLPVVRGRQVTQNRIFVYLLLQIAVTLLLVPAGIGGSVYLAGAGILGAAMLGMTLLPNRTPQPARWARGVFFASIIYLPLLLILMFI